MGEADDAALLDTVVSDIVAAIDAVDMVPAKQAV